MVMRILLLTLVSGLFAPVASARDALTVEPDSGSVEYGKPAFVTLQAFVPRPRLDGIALGALEKDFVVQQLAGVEQDGRRQRWRLRLYPRRVGDLVIPALQLGDLRSRPVPLAVTPPLDPRSGQPVTVSFDIVPGPVWLNQPVPIRVSIVTDNPWAQLEYGDLVESGMLVRTLPIVSDRLNGHDSGNHSLVAGWSLVPRSSGTQAIQLPAIGYRHDGVVTHRFFPPQLNFEVRPLPAYVPATLPVGDVTVEADTGRSLLLTDRLAFLTLRVRGDDPGGQHAAAILRQLTSDARVTFYPPESEPPLPGSDSVTWRIAFTPRATGLLDMPTLRLQYFEPAGGTLQSRHLPLGTLIAVNPWVAWIGAAVLVLTGYLLLLRLAVWLATGRRRLLGYRAALQHARLATGPEDLRAALAAMARAEGWPANLTIDQWVRNWSNNYRQDPEVRELGKALQRWLYGRRPAALQPLSEVLSSICFRHAPLLKVPLLR